MHLPDTGRLARGVGWSSLAKVPGMFLIIVGSKFWMLRMCSGPLPVFDQWEAEGQGLLRPWLHGQLHLADLFAPWVQHRIVWSRLLVLGLFRLNGQWDTQVEAIAAECLHAGTAVLLAAILIRRLGRAWEDAILLCLALFFAPPFALEDTLSGGFASQYYTLVLFAVVTIWGLASHRPGAAGWWVGVAGAIAAWFSVATGGLPSLAVAAWMGLRLARREGSLRENATTLAAALALGVGGLGLSIGVGQLTDLQPRSVGDLLVRFAGLLGWPNPTAWIAPLAYAPFAGFLWWTLRSRRATGRAEAFLIPLGIFALLNTAALAYARNRYGDLAVSRYMDFLSIGALVNLACLLLFLRDAGEFGFTARTRAGLRVLTAAWVGAAGFGLIQLTAGNLADDLPASKSHSEHKVENIAAFIARPDAQKISRTDTFDLLCEKPALVADLLQDPEILRILPAQVRRPVVLEAASASPLVHRLMPDATNPGKGGWLLEPGHNGQPVHFRSQTISGLRLPYLRFPEVSDMGAETFIALVDERSGDTIWLQQDAPINNWQRVLVKTPPGPFRVEAVIAAGASRPLAFSFPREVGWLSAWVDPILNAAPGLLFAGLAAWLGAIFWRRLGLDALTTGWRRVPLDAAGFPGVPPPPESVGAPNALHEAPAP